MLDNAEPVALEDVAVLDGEVAAAAEAPPDDVVLACVLEVATLASCATADDVEALPDMVVLTTCGEDDVVTLLGMASSLATFGACGSSGANMSATLRGGDTAPFGTT